MSDSSTNPKTAVLSGGLSPIKAMATWLNSLSESSKKGAVVVLLALCTIASCVILYRGLAGTNERMPLPLEEPVLPYADSTIYNPLHTLPYETDH
ncbi:hypothetical protein FHS59_000098 [Algoriphagus iocasae]|uniref:Uncharacterized protein n=1 Tax=Algoriphagus iocasae TaxID=1836499 RepID=A0A841MCN8_9BACT|nr:hypothetical protein [Algoriphagus iocasae]MBB6324483.1 hypothetical protein [Algoriphagus iocasae]